jgi:hypothetical protein
MRLTDEQARSLSMMNAGNSEPLLRTTIYRASRAATLTDQELDFLVNYGRAVQHERDEAAGRSGVTPQRWSIGSPSREQVDTAIGAVLFNVRNFPEAAQARLLGQDMGALRSKITEAVAAVLSQPNPSAEPVCACGHPEFDHGHSEGDGCLHCPCKELIATQPRIEDMAPGTTFTAEGVGVSGTLHRFTVTDQRSPGGHRYLRCATHDGNGAIESYVEPSTIRDVTPPKEADG